MKNPLGYLAVTLALTPMVWVALIVFDGEPPAGEEGAFLYAALFFSVCIITVLRGLA